MKISSITRLIGVLALALIAKTTWADSVKVTAERASLRASATTSSEIVGTVVRGDVLEVVTLEGAWYRVKATGSGVEGYIHSAIVDAAGTTQPTAPSRISTAATAAAGPLPADGTSRHGYTAETFEIGPTLGFGGTGFGGSKSIGGRFEKAFKDLDGGVLSIGAFVQRWSFDPCAGVLSNCGASTTFFGATVNYHFKIQSNRRWDPFVGLGLGYARFSWDGTVYGRFAVSSGVEFVGNAGLRYYFTDKIAVYADLGAGAATANVGLMFKLK